MKKISRPVPRFGRQAWAWCFYDWADSVFATTVMAGFFPIFFKNFWSVGVEATTSSARLGVISSLASLGIGLLGPFLGAAADRRGRIKPYLALLAVPGMIATALLALVPQGEWLTAAFCYLIGLAGFTGGSALYDALLPKVAPTHRLDAVSSAGYALGYLAGGLMLALNVAMVLKPETFGLAGPEQAVAWSFVLVAIWWAVFSLPLFFLVRETSTPGGSTIPTLSRLIRTLKSLPADRPLFLFLLAYWLYIDGVHTLMRMAVDFGLSIGFSPQDLISALLLVQFVGLPASLLFGYIGSKVGTMTGILLALTIYLGISVWGVFIDTRLEFYLLAAAIGLAQGGIQALSRSWFAAIIRPEQAGELFGLFNLVGRFSTVLGPVLMGGTAVLLHASGLEGELASRLSLLVLALFFVGGGVLAVAAQRARQTS
ncbi:MAG: MFS transporter [Deltaproteobacteria bacterium]|nr:MFS transporter [Deltaproteobacteria bacterium]